MIKQMDLDEDYYDDEDKYFIYEKKLSKKVYHVNFDKTIAAPHLYREFYKICTEARSSDVINININSNGGNADTMVQMINAIMYSKAKVVAKIFSAASAAGCIALACDEINVAKYGSIMLHATSWATSGKVGEMKAQSDFIHNYDSLISKDLYKTILNDKEMELLTEGKDFWFTEPELKKRLEKWKPVMTKSFI